MKTTSAFGIFGIRVRMRPVQKSMCALMIVLTASLAFLYLHVWSPKPYNSVDLRPQPDQLPKTLLPDHLLVPDKKYAHIAFHIKEEILELLPKNSCKCEAHTSLNLPFQKELFGQEYALEFTNAIQSSDLEDLNRKRKKEYRAHQQRSQSPLDHLIIVQANSPLEFPVQGVEVRPLETILIPGLSLQAAGRTLYRVNLTATMGTFNLAAEVEGVKAEGEGRMHLSLTGSQLDNVNRQMQFVTYTNTIFHPNTVDTVQFSTDEHRASFNILIRFVPTPKLYYPGSSTGGASEGTYNISALVTIATKTFLRYDKLRVLIDSIRKFYPTVTIIIADDSQDIQHIQGPHIEHYIMPFGKVGDVLGQERQTQDLGAGFGPWDAPICPREPPWKQRRMVRDASGSENGGPSAAFPSSIFAGRGLQEAIVAKNRVRQPIFTGRVLGPPVAPLMSSWPRPA